MTADLSLDMTVSDLLVALQGRVSRPDKTLRCALRKYSVEVSPSKRGARWEQLRLASFERNMPFVDKDISEIQPYDIAEWRELRVFQASAGTALREMTLLRSVFESARREWRWLKTNPMQGLRRPTQPPPRDRRINQEEVDLILSGLGYELGTKPSNKSQRIAVAFLFAIETGMRCGEICALKWRDVKLQRRYLTVNVSKNGDKRQVPLSKRAIALILLLYDNRIGLNDEVFALSPGTVDVLFRRSRTKVGIVDLHFHDTRHEAITRLAQKISILDLARMVGIRDLKTLTVYYNATAEEIASRLD